MTDKDILISDLNDISEILNNNGYGGWCAIIRKTVALLKQEAVEPYITGNGESFETAETWWYECGNCNKPIDPNDKFCRHCGKAVKWSEID